MSAKLCTTGDTQISKFELGNFTNGCPGCDGTYINCYACKDLKAPNYWKMKIADFGNSVCNLCGSWNGTYLFTNSSCGRTGVDRVRLAAGDPSCEGCGESGGYDLEFGISYFPSVSGGMPGSPPPYPYPQDLDTGYIWAEITNGCANKGNLPQYGPFGTPICCPPFAFMTDCGRGYQAIYYWLNTGPDKIDCRDLKSIEIPLQYTTTAGTPHDCWDSWDVCTAGTVTLTSV